MLRTEPAAEPSSRLLGEVELLGQLGDLAPDAGRMSGVEDVVPARRPLLGGRVDVLLAGEQPLGALQPGQDRVEGSGGQPRRFHQVEPLLGCLGIVQEHPEHPGDRRGHPWYWCHERYLSTLAT
jgi:hypothetical protein